jgi:hypothetical protein
VDIPFAVEQVVRHALEKSPDKRPGSAEQMLSELEQAAAASQAVESGVRPVRNADDLPESLRLAERRSWVLGALLAVTLLVLLAVVLAIGRRPEPASNARQASGATPTPAPKVPAPTALENSVSAADASAAGQTPQAAPATSAISTRPAPLNKKAPPKSKPATPLERRGNERYGRFE